MVGCFWPNVAKGYEVFRPRDEHTAEGWKYKLVTFLPPAKEIDSHAILVFEHWPDKGITVARVMYSDGQVGN